MELTFHDWVCSFNEFPSPIGDFHDDVVNDPDFPKTDDWLKIKFYLQEHPELSVSLIDIEIAFIFYVLKTNKAYMQGNKLIPKNDNFVSLWQF